MKIYILSVTSLALPWSHMAGRMDALERKHEKPDKTLTSALPLLASDSRRPGNDASATSQTHHVPTTTRTEPRPPPRNREPPFPGSPFPEPLPQTRCPTAPPTPPRDSPLPGSPFDAFPSRPIRACTKECQGCLGPGRENQNMQNMPEKNNPLSWIHWNRPVSPAT